MIGIVPGLAAAALMLRLFGVGLTWLPSPALLLLGIAAFHLSVATARHTTRDAWKRWARTHAFGIALAAIVVLALAVRVPGFASDLGHVPLDIDENRLASNVKHYFATGELNHGTVEHYPGAVFWMLSAASFLSFVRGLGSGSAMPAEMLPVETFAYAARASNVLVAGATVALTGLIGRRIGGRAAGLLAAAVTAIVPLSVDTTVLVRNDGGMVLAVVAAVLLALKAYDDGRRSLVAAAGAMAGVATGIKYSAMFALAPVLIAAAAAPLATRVRAYRAILACVVFTSAVMVTNHFVWWDFPNFLEQLSDQVAITGRGHWAATDNPAAGYFMMLDRFGPGGPLLILAGGYAVYGLSTRRAVPWIFLSFPILYVMFMTQRPSQFPRWVYPALPFACVAGAAALAALVKYSSMLAVARPKPVRLLVRTAALAFGLLVLGQPVRAGAIAFSRRVTPTTHTLTERWLNTHAAAGQVVILGEGWLELGETALVTRRVRNLRAALDEGVSAFSGADWLVVPEPYFFHPTLKQLGLVHRVHAGQWFGGNQGYDYEVYSVPRL